MPFPPYLRGLGREALSSYLGNPLTWGILYYHEKLLSRPFWAVVSPYGGNNLIFVMFAALEPVMFAAQCHVGLFLHLNARCHCPAPRSLCYRLVLLSAPLHHIKSRITILTGAVSCFPHLNSPEIFFK